MKQLLLKSLAAVLTVLVLAGTVYSEEIKGSLKALAEDAKVFTIDSTNGKVLFINYNKATRWHNLNKPGELEPGDFLSVVITRKEDQTSAVSVTKAIVTPPSDFTLMTTEKLSGSVDPLGMHLPFALIDSRPVEDFDAAHIPGAVSIPLSRLKKQSAELLPDDKNTSLVFYDQGAGGVDALAAARLARIAGYSNISVYADGIAGWLKSGRFAASSAAFIRKKKPGIVDLREEEMVRKGHLIGAASIPFKKLPEMQDIFPTDKRVPIVLYGDSNQQSVLAAKTIRNWGYRNVTIYIGGTTTWTESAEVLSTKTPEAFVLSPGSTHSGQLSAADFEMALLSPATVELLDIRNSSDFKKGNFPNSRHISLQELPLRHKELSRDRFQVVFGSDEQHSEMACDFLKQFGYRITYLKGSIHFSKDGKYQVK